MTKSIFLIFLFSISITSYSQKNYDEKAAAASSDAIWYGIDFSKCKFIGNPAIGDRGYKSPQLVVKYSFGDWNSIPLAEAGKYDIKGTFDKDYVTNDISAVSALNKTYNPDSLIAFGGSYTLDKNQIPGMIAKYDGLSKEGVGLVYIVESYDGIKELGTYYAVMFDIASKKVLFCEKVTGIPAGAILKTYWAGAFRDALSNTKSIYKKWKKGLTK